MPNQTQNDGGPAFPRPTSFSPTTGEPHMAGHSGMSLRDWFAGKAMQGILSDPSCDFGHLWRNDKGESRILSGANHPLSDGTNWKHIAGPNERMAAQCYSYADAMLKAREAKP